MKIGIDASRAFLKNRTGIEEYSYRVIDGLKNNLQNEQVVLYVRKTDNLQLTTDNGNTKINELELPANWSVKVIKWPRFWTQIGLSLELLLHPIDALFVPAHTVPIFHPARNATRFFNNAFIWQVRKLFNSKEEWKYMHSVAGGPKKTVVVVHGLEYEFCPEAYSFLEKFYMRWTIKKSCQ
ncbi:MAG: Glycosyl transferase group 1, partial [Candidatus Moranbacteria bacterium GW2011_GWD2_38_7]